MHPRHTAAFITSVVTPCTVPLSSSSTSLFVCHRPNNNSNVINHNSKNNNNNNNNNNQPWKMKSSCSCSCSCSCSFSFSSSLTPRFSIVTNKPYSKQQQQQQQQQQQTSVTIKTTTTKTITTTAQLGSPSTQIGRPKTSIKKDIGRVTSQPDEPKADAEKGSARARPRRKTQADEVPLYKVILLGDEEYVEAHVVTQIQKTVQLDKGEATRIFREAQSTGSSIICVVCEEHAEFYAQQLRRQDIFVVVEKDE